MSDSATNLDRLHDIVSPPEVSWWPLAGAWYFAAVGVLIFVGILGYRAWDAWKGNAYRRAALRELERASDISTVAEILRRTALVIAPRSIIASKAGNAWVDWLEAATSDPMPDEVRHQLALGIYDRSDGDFTKVSQYASQWIRLHQADLNCSDSI